MSDNKFIQRLKGQQTPKSVVEVQNDKLVAPFTGVPYSTDVVGAIIDDKDSSVVVAKGAQNWKLNGSSLVAASSLSGDGADYTGEFNASGSSLWINATYSLSATIFNAGTKWVLKLCGKNLLSTSGDTIGFTMIVKIGSTHITTKAFTVAEGANVFCRQLVIDFSESEQAVIKAQSGDSLTVQLLCADANASATIYNGMTILTALQRKVDSDAVASDTRNFDELEEDFDDLKSDYDQFVIDTQTALDGKVNIDGTSVMTAPLKFAAGSMRGAVGPYLNGVGFWKINSGGTITQIATLSDSQFLPITTNAINFGSSSRKWKDLYLAGKAYITTLNNGADLAVPNKAGTLATMGDVELAARSGRMLTDQGVWYAKMYSATIPPAAENGTNYADFSQVDGDNNPIIVIYTRTSGAWAQSETITPPADYDGYVPITSKIWDIAEQSGQQGGRVLWNHTSKEFTPYPVIISFEDIEITGNSTVIMPNNPSGNQIINKDYFDTHVPTMPTVGDGTITLTQGGVTKGTFTTNQSGDATIDFDATSSGGYHPDLFDFKWSDHELDDVQWLRADTFSWQSGSVYEAAYWELFYDIQISTYWYLGNVGPAYTKSRTPAVGDAVYLNSNLTTQIGTVAAYDDVNDAITVGANTYTFMSNTYVTPTTETVAGHTLTVYTGHSGRKIVGQVNEYDVSLIYNDTGVAWYYIIDLNNKRFKLPRTKFGFTGLRDNVGKYVEPGLPDITGSMSVAIPNAYQNYLQGAFSVDTSNNHADGSHNGSFGGIKFDASNSNSIYGNSATVQPAATQMYLYFYVGEFTQEAIENTAGLNASLFNNKADLDLANVLANIDFVVQSQLPTANNNYTWYRKYKSGWVEQGGRGTKEVTVTLPVTMADAYYTAIAGFSVTANDYISNDVCVAVKTTTGFLIKSGSSVGTNEANWYVSGIAA